MSGNFAAHPSIPADRDILVCIFQRGAADGLNALAPYSDADYYLHRPTIAIPEPGQVNGGIYVTDDFALHPALAPLKPIYDAGNLALVHATGMPHQNRSHFAAQNLVERGVIDKAGPQTGWLGRHLQQLPAASNSAFRTISISGNVPVALGGATDPLAIDNLNAGMAKIGATGWNFADNGAHWLPFVWGTDDAMEAVRASAEADDARVRSRLVSERTRDQSYTLAKPVVRAGLTGDPEVDRLIAPYRRPSRLGAA